MDIAGYKVIKQIGEGGMSRVYLARQIMTGRQVALKICSDPVFMQQGVFEADTVGHLSHPNVVPVYDMGSYQNISFIAMEYIKGGDLRQKLGQGLNPWQSILYLKQIAQALIYAHSLGYIHRDLKPENILFGSDMQAMLSDFGTAIKFKHVNQPVAQAFLIGTPNYMSPEQAQGEPISIQTDFYSLGVIFYEMLTGHLPYESDTAKGLLYLQTTLPTPLLPDYLHMLQPVLNMLMAKLPAERYRNALALVRDLEQLEPLFRDFKRIKTIKPFPMGENKLRHSLSQQREQEQKAQLAAQKHEASPKRMATLWLMLALSVYVGIRYYQQGEDFWWQDLQRVQQGYQESVQWSAQQWQQLTTPAEPAAVQHLANDTVPQLPAPVNYVASSYTPTPKMSTEPSHSVEPQIAAWLAKARILMLQKKFFSPASENANLYINKILQRQPDHLYANKLRSDLAERCFEKAFDAAYQMQNTLASKWLTRASAIKPADPRVDQLLNLIHFNTQANHSAEDSVLVVQNTQPFLPQMGDKLQFSQFFSTRTPRVGEQITLSYQLTNDYAQSIGWVKVLGQKVAGLTYLNHSGDGIYDYSSHTWMVNDLSPNSRQRLQISFRVDGLETITNQVWYQIQP